MRPGGTVAAGPCALALTGLCLLGNVGLADAQEDPRLGYAACVGGGDHYAKMASEYGYDADAHAYEAGLYMELLMTGPNPPERAALDQRREEGRREYKALADALNGRSEGKEWDAFVAFTLRCDGLRGDLYANGIFGHDNQD